MEKLTLSVNSRSKSFAKRSHDSQVSSHLHAVVVHHVEIRIHVEIQAQRDPLNIRGFVLLMQQRARHQEDIGAHFRSKCRGACVLC